jgi:undecaprenyl-diphosphatase
MVKRQRTSPRSIALRAALAIALLAVGVYVLARNWHTVQLSFVAARHAEAGWLVIGLALMALTFAIAAAIYGVLALHRLRYSETILIEVSTAFVNRLLPSGIGGLGLHGVYLYKKKHTPAEATVVVSVNNLIGMLAHLLLLAALLLLHPDTFDELLGGHDIHVSWPAILVVSALLLGAVSLPNVRKKISAFGSNLLESIRHLSVVSILKALALAVLMTLTYTMILLSSARSVDIDLTGLQLFIVFSVGMLASTAAPTPGGLVGAEAGLYAGFIAYGVQTVPAAAAVLLYRLVSYWIPLIPGALALLTARRHKLV